LIRQKSNYNRFRKLLSKDHFSDKLTRLIFKAIEQIHNEHKIARIPIQDLIDFCQVYLEKADDRKEIKKVLRIIKRVSSTKSDPEVSNEIVTRFLQRRAAQGLVLDTIHMLETTEGPIDWGEIKKKVERASGVSAVSLDYLSYFDSSGEERRSNHRKPISTGMSKLLDKHMGGGLGIGELGVVEAPPGIGKTTTLINLGVGGLKKGKKVVHITLEIKGSVVARRYDMRIGRVTFEQIQSKDVRLSRRLRDLKELGGVLVIKDLANIRCKVSDIRSFLDSLLSQSLGFDMVLVDYAALLEPTKGYKEKRHELDEIYKDLRRLANEFKIGLWTAAQASKESLRRRVSGLEHLAEHYGIGAHADFVISVNQTPEEKEDGVVRIFLPKTRESSKNVVIPCLIDFDRMLIKARRSHAN